MSATLEARAEITKLARLLGTEPQQLSYLEGIDPDGLISVRMAATDLLFDDDGGMMKRLGAGAKLLPAGVLATIAERTFGPLLCARVAGAVDPSKAVEVAAKLKPRFLADVAIEIDPRKAKSAIGKIPPAQGAEVAVVLSAEEEYVTMGRFLAYIEDDAITACLEVIPDEALLPTAFVLEDKSRLDHVLRMLPDERAVNVTHLAYEHDLWGEALDLAEHVSDEQATRLADIVAAQSDEILTSLINSATEHGLWPDLLPVSRVMSLQSRERFATVEAISEPATLKAIVSAAIAETDLWADLVMLVPALDTDAQARVAAEVAALSPDRQAGLVAAASERDLWVPLLTIAAQLDPATQERMIDLVAEADDSVVEGLIRSVDAADSWEQLGDLAGGVPPDRLERLTAQAERLGLGERLTSVLSR
jgi:hypothetical protein